MKFAEYGHPTSKAVIYFHGVPGSTSEASLFDSPALEHGLRVMCFDRFSIPSSYTGAAYYRYIADAVSESTQGAPVDFIGFSMGCHVALESSYYLPNHVNNLHLISGVAPPDKGNFLDGMAGKAVFSLAKNHPFLFKMLSQWQSLLAARMPDLLFRMLFASAVGQDSALANQPEFKRFMATVLADCFSQGIKGYTRDIDQYLATWSDTVFDFKGHVHLWHGVQDNWSPMAMSDYLAQSLPGTPEIERIEELSHYSCLHYAIPRICRLLSTN